MAQMTPRLCKARNGVAHGHRSTEARGMPAGSRPRYGQSYTFDHSAASHARTVGPRFPSLSLLYAQRDWFERRSRRTPSLLRTHTQRQQGICRAFRPFLHVADPPLGAFIKLPALRVVHDLNAILV